MPVTGAARARRAGAAFLTLASLSVPASARAAEPTAGACESSYEGVQLSRQQGKLLAARDLTAVCMRASCPEVARKDCSRWSDELSHEIPSVVLVARDAYDRDVAPLRLVVDGVARSEIAGGRALELDPGAHVVRVERPDAPPIEQTFTVYQGEHDRIVRVTVPAAIARPEPPQPPPVLAPSPPSPLRHEKASIVPPLVVGAASVAVLGASAYLGLSGRQELSSLRSTCAPGCTDAQVDPVRTRLTASDVLLGVGVVGAAIAVTLFALRGSF